MIDFKKLLDEKETVRVTDPLEIFKRLDKKSGKEYLRPHQETILSQWKEKFSERKDTIVKMHTGQGKTLVGLLMLQSSINEGLGPAIYLCPNNYLVRQIIEESKSFGIPTVEFDGAGAPPPLKFLNSEAILVANCYKLFNGKSVFGVSGVNRDQIKVGSIVMDDAHRCLDLIQESFAINITNRKEGVVNPIYQKLLNLFESSLMRQAAGTCSDIKDNSDAYMVVPFWSWMDKKDDVLNILQENKESDEIKYEWELLKNKLQDCTCIISGKEIEIFPRLTPIEMIPSFVNTKRRIFLSATLTEDAFLVRDLDVEANSVNEPLILEDVKYSGERMILIPTLLNPNITREDVIKWISKYAQNHGEFGIIALVPSNYYVKDWKDVGGQITNVKNLNETILDLKKLIENKAARHVTVLLNEYDGVDLPDATCRILCLDSVPSYISLKDLYVQEVRPNSNIIHRQLTQRIEQGIGRGIRGSSDYCVIIATGNKLTNFLAEKEKSKFLSNDTKEQIKIADRLATAMKKDEDHNLKAVENVIEQCITRDEGWKEFYHSTMKKIDKTPTNNFFLDVSKLERKAEIHFQNRQYQKAADTIQEIIDMNTEDHGWYFQLMATYLYPLDRTSSMDKQVKAHEKNNGFSRPEEGITYSKLSNSSDSREGLILEWLTNHESQNEIIIDVNSILDNIAFGIPPESFEDGIKKLGAMLGFTSQRPEKKNGTGSDNLWCITGRQYWLISCKNDVELGRDFISKKEAGQLSNEIAWFSQEYSGCAGKPIFIHPSSKLNSDAFLSSTAYVITPEKLKLLKQNVQKLFQSFTGTSDLSYEKIKQKLAELQLDLISLNTIYFETVSN